MKRLLILCFIFLLFLAACTSSKSVSSTRVYHLAEFSQNYVTVEINLQQDPARKAFLTATFTPESGYHLYSKDLPRAGVYGEGRPTLLELTPQSRMHSTGELSASASAEVSDMGTEALLVYPACPVTLQLQVSLPSGIGWYDDQVSITYEACSEMTCRTPVIGKLLAVRVPESGIAQP